MKISFSIYFLLLLLFRSIEGRRFRLAPIWPEWNETDINNESWDTGYIKKKETSSVRSRTDIKTNLSIVYNILIKMFL